MGNTEESAIDEVELTDADLEGMEIPDFDASEHEEEGDVPLPSDVAESMEDPSGKAEMPKPEITPKHQEKTKQSTNFQTSEDIDYELAFRRKIDGILNVLVGEDKDLKKKLGSEWDENHPVDLKYVMGEISIIKRELEELKSMSGYFQGYGQNQATRVIPQGHDPHMYQEFTMFKNMVFRQILNQYEIIQRLIQRINKG